MTSSTSTYNLQSIFERFDTSSTSTTGHTTNQTTTAEKEEDTFVSAESYGSGHINDTFRITTTTTTNHTGHAGRLLRYYILQRINHNVFTRPVEVMDNIRRITEHMTHKIKARGGDPTRETLSLFPAAAAAAKKSSSSSSSPQSSSSCWYVIDEDGNYWRLYNYISDARSYEIGEKKCSSSSSNDDDGGGMDDDDDNDDDDHRHVREAAAAFARFQRDVSDISPPRLHETIPKFGDTSYRYQQFEMALEADSKNRAKLCRNEIDFARARKAEASILSDLLTSGQISERIAHYDTKLNNVLIDNRTGKGICVIDLDTVMPGLVIYDFGDAVRGATSLSTEDETDLSKVGFCMKKFIALTEGYLTEAREFLTDMEIDHLAFAARMVTYTIGLRFLTDYLMGDVYFKTDAQRDEHQNLDRCRTQFKMVKDMEDQFDEMKNVVNRYRKK